jgi:hypothetical protein
MGLPSFGARRTQRNDQLVVDSAATSGDPGTLHLLVLRHSVAIGDTFHFHFSCVVRDGVVGDFDMTGALEVAGAFHVCAHGLAGIHDVGRGAALVPIGINRGYI